MNMGQYEEQAGFAAGCDTRPPCRKCNGTGRFIAFKSGRDCGECFACSGSGRWGVRAEPQIDTSLMTPEGRVKYEAAPPVFAFPKIVDIVLRNNIKLNLGHSRVVMTQAGKLCLVSVVFGVGYYGTFERNGEFRPTGQCTDDMVAALRDVEARGIEAVKEIGRLTGVCCVCSRTLTDDRSIADGIGPICAGRMQW